MEIYRYCPICTSNLTFDSMDGVKRQHCQNCGFVRFQNPSPSAGTVAIMDGKVVMIKRGRQPAKGKWSFPSGFIELGETPEEAALREMEEESGVTGEIIDFIGVYHDCSEVYGHILVIMYLVNVTGGELKAGDDAIDTRLFFKKEMPRFRFKSFKKTWEKARMLCELHGIKLE